MPGKIEGKMRRGWQRMKWLDSTTNSVDISLSLVAKWCPTLVTPWTVACEAPLSMGFSRQEYWSGLPFSSPWDPPDPGVKLGSPALQINSLPTELRGKPKVKVKVAQSCPTLCEQMDLVHFRGPASAGSRGYPQDERCRRERDMRPARAKSARERERKRERVTRRGCSRVWQSLAESGNALFLPWLLYPKLVHF